MMDTGDRQGAQRALLERVREVSGILRERRPDLIGSIIRTLDETAARLQKAQLSEEDLDWIDSQVLQYLCHPKCLYDFCPLPRLDGETEQAQWQRWGAIVDRMREQAARLCRLPRRGRKR